MTLTTLALLLLLLLLLLLAFLLGRLSLPLQRAARDISRRVRAAQPPKRRRRRTIPKA